MYQKSVNSEVVMPCDGVGQPKPNIIWRKVRQSFWLYLAIAQHMLLVVSLVSVDHLYVLFGPTIHLSLNNPLLFWHQK